MILCSSERVGCASAWRSLSARASAKTLFCRIAAASRDIRFTTENRLKTGDVRAVVATSSLELGIDIGSVNLVVQLGSPRSIGVALQRVGRSGHWIGAKP